MSPTCIEPELETPVAAEPMTVEESELAAEPEPAGRTQRIRDLLVTIFAGHEEFLGWTPD